MEFFDVLTMTKVGTLNIGRFFTLLIRVNNPGLDYIGGDRLVQETAIGYSFGSFFKCGVICKHFEEGKSVGEKRQKLDENVEMQEESKEESKADLD